MNPNLCRLCSSADRHSFVDLGLSPLSNAFIRPEHVNKPEVFHPLHAFICEACLLVQLEQVESPEQIFHDYAYFSSFSASWVQHAQRYVEHIIPYLGLRADHRVVELASNDGYLLQFFAARDIPVQGVEPAANVAEQAIQKGIPTLTDFFGTKLAKQMMASDGPADLIIGNNVLAHVPALNDFVEGMKLLLHAQGTITMEFPHLLRLMQENQFDTIYHEHFSYFSFITVEQLFRNHQLVIYDVEELPTHGGSLRIYAQHAASGERSVTERVHHLLAKEHAAQLDQLSTYLSFASQVEETKRHLLRFLIEERSAGKHFAGYGAPAKGNTLLNYCGIRRDFIDYVVDRNPYKQGLFLPGTRIPVYEPDRLRETKPDYVIIMPWNIRHEIMEQTEFIRSWGGRWVVFIPQLEVIS